MAVSYASDLEALDASLRQENAQPVLDKLGDLETKVTLPADKAALALIEAKASMFAIGATKGCRMMKVVRRNDLPASMKSDLDDGLKACQ